MHSTPTVPAAVRSATTPRHFALRDAALLWGIVIFAGIVRGVFFTGYFGSDEVTYTESAYRIVMGDWSVSTYVGANRYGVNLPVAAYGVLFGRNLISAALHSLICSLAEIGLLTYFARRWFGARTAVIAGLLMACLPLHVHFAGRLMADAPLALAITASFLLFWEGEARGKFVSFLLAGIAAGLSFWVKPAAIFYVLVFCAYPIVFLRWNIKWAWMVAGFALVILANCLMFWMLTGNPWFLFEALRSRNASSYLEAGAALGEIRDAPNYYLLVLFLRLHQTWLIGYWAAFAVIGFALHWRNLAADPADPRRFIVLWALGLIGLLSLLVVSWTPLMFVPKQTNYMLIFTAPLCLLAALALARLKGVGLMLALAVTLIPSLLLAGMHQGLVRVFTANSMAAVQFAASRPGSLVYGTTNGVRAAEFHNLVEPGDVPVSIRPLREVMPPSNARPETSAPRYAVVDTETLNWGSDEPFRDLDHVPACWVRELRLPVTVSGAGWHLMNGMAAVAKMLPPALGAPLALKLEDLAMPDPAWVFRVPESGCP